MNRVIKIISQAALLALVAAFVSAFLWSSANAGPPEPDQYRVNAAGQLLIGYLVSPPDGWVWRTHTVRLVDRAPKTCGDPDGTRRFTWFFTDAMMIEVESVEDQMQKPNPSTPIHREAHIEP